MLKPDAPNNPNKIPISAIPNNINLGQPEWKHPENDRISILKKISVKPHSTKNWSNVIWDKKSECPLEVNKQMADEYTVSIQKISDMAQ